MNTIKTIISAICIVFSFLFLFDFLIYSLKSTPKRAIFPQLVWWND